MKAPRKSMSATHRERVRRGVLRHYAREREMARILPADLRALRRDGSGLRSDLRGVVEEAYAGSPRLRTEFFKLGTTAGTSGSAEGDVAFTRSDSSAPNTGATLLEQAEERGLEPEFGCRMGICFSCVSRKTEGTVRNVLTGEKSSLPDEDVRICVSAPVGSCSVDL